MKVTGSRIVLPFDDEGIRRDLDGNTIVRDQEKYLEVFPEPGALYRCQAGEVGEVLAYYGLIDIPEALSFDPWSFELMVDWMPKARRLTGGKRPDGLEVFATAADCGSSVVHIIRGDLQASISCTDAPDAFWASPLKNAMLKANDVLALFSTVDAEAEVKGIHIHPRYVTHWDPEPVDAQNDNGGPHAA